MAPSKPNTITLDVTPAQTNGVLPTKTESLADALSSYSVESIRDSSKISFLEPRGLVNTGNMCYMNSVRLHSIEIVIKLTSSPRFCKFLSPAFHSIISLIILGKELRIVLKVIPR